MKIECGTCKWLSRHKSKNKEVWFLCDELDMRISGPSDKYAKKCEFYKQTKSKRNLK